MWDLDYIESWVLKNWCFWTVKLEKTLQSLLNIKEIQRVHPKGNQSWIFIGRTDAKAETPILWPPVENWLNGKYPDAGKHWRREQKGTTEDKMVSKLRELLKDRETWRAALHGVATSRTRMGNWTELKRTNDRDKRHTRGNFPLRKSTLLIRVIYNFLYKINTHSYYNSKA